MHNPVDAEKHAFIMARATYHGGPQSVSALNWRVSGRVNGRYGAPGAPGPDGSHPLVLLSPRPSCPLPPPAPLTTPLGTLL